MKSMCLFIALSSCCFASLDSARQEGKALGNIGKNQALTNLKNYPSNDLIPQDQKGKKFESDHAKDQATACAKSQEYSPPESTTDFLRSPDTQLNIEKPKNEYFIENSEALANCLHDQTAEAEDASEYKIETCKVPDAPYPISIIRNLNVEVAYSKEERFRKLSIRVRKIPYTQIF